MKSHIKAKSPKNVLENVKSKIIADPDNFLNNQKYKQDRENFVIASILLGIYKITGVPWLMKEPEDVSQDGIAIRYESENIKIINELIIPIQVVFIPNNIKENWNNNISDEENIYNFIFEKKIKNKKYEKGTSLFIYFNIILSQFNFPKLIDLLLINYSYEAIWCLSCVSKDKSDYMINQIYPINLYTELNIKDIYNLN